MAQKYTGPHSPGTSSTWDGARRSRAGARANALFIAPIPLLFTGWGQDPSGLAMDLSAFFALIAAAKLTRDGLRAEDAYLARVTARRPALPRKALGAALLGLGLFLAGLPSIGGGLVLAALGAALHVGAFGFDPWRNKLPGGAPVWQAERVARAVDEAESHLASMRKAIEGTGDRKLVTRVDQFIATARRLFRRIEQDPRDLPQARRWLGVYLLGAQEAARKYADLSAKARTEQDRAQLVALLDDLDQGFAQRTETLLLDDRADLGIEIDVLRERLDREGLALKALEETE
ncbi:5-bromo-4-chloroindolyl phosphate hydrolysis family protein [Palleronia caenipelagi]|uniref:5-bromo-4-chloroindolyl phosphate hydrolase n=1 Tax=Palleronia caenipelagi TaxID=2489174 RepID=A0A547Q084_9RHOB|nr:5-bromo-4-chloroindolyl phosphate hydrolysis family protein [Palleronia caenipelagi]TRD19802.1 hypothetical protein FEV53_10170 [Palleronia caenipelagi]